MLRMKVKAVGMNRETLFPVVILSDEAEESYVPLLIGPAEANAIAVVLENVEAAASYPRPLAQLGSGLGRQGGQGGYHRPQ